MTTDVWTPFLTSFSKYAPANPDEKHAHRTAARPIFIVKNGRVKSKMFSDCVCYFKLIFASEQLINVENQNIAVVGCL